MKKITALLTILTLLSLTGCLKKPTSPPPEQRDDVELTYYRLFDDQDIFEPLIRQYETENSHVTINYRKFTEPEEYLDLIINELAEGEGPDIFSMHNTWFSEHRKKLNPAPTTLISEESFGDVFVSVASDDLILPNDSGIPSVYGLPMYVDTLALYYNEDQFEDKIPSRGEPATTWGELQEDVFKLTKSDNSFERFEVAGIAMGRADNILRALDTLYLLMIQFGVNFYDEGYTEATFADGVGQPGAEALSFLTSFSLPSSKYYCWNAYLADDDSSEKEITTFARGKTSMILGYSYLYEQVMDQIDELEKKGDSAISKNTVKVAPIPQLEDPETSTEKRDAYASYFAETVSRTSPHANEAWKFLSYLVTQESLTHYHEQTHRPTSRRDMIEAQTDEAIYGIFADQIGYAESFPVSNNAVFTEAFEGAIEAVLGTEDPQKALSNAQDLVNTYMPDEGLYPAIVTPTEE